MKNFMSIFSNGFSQNEEEDPNNNDNANNNNQNQNSNNNSNNSNNNTNNNESQTSIWEDPQQQQDQNQNQNFQQQQQQQNPEEAMKAHIAGLKLTDGIDLTKIQEDLQNGSTESLNASFAKIAENSYTAAINSANSLIDNKIAAMRTELKNESTAEVNKNLAVQTMHRELKFTDDKDIGPIAAAVLDRYMKTQPMDQAIESVGKFFNKIKGSVNIDANPPQNSGDSFRNSFHTETEPTNFNNNNSSSSRKGDPSHKDWLSILAPGQSR